VILNGMTTNTHNKSITRTRRVLAAAAVIGSAVAGVASTVATAPDAEAATTYVRFENIIDRWAMNTGFTEGTLAEGATVQLWWWAPHDPWNSRWSWKHMGNGYYQYKNRWSKKCLDVSSLSFSAQMIQSTCNDADKGQHWLDVPAGTHNGKQTYQLRNRGVTEKLGVPMTATADHTGSGAKVKVQVLADQASTQRWFFDYVTN
jgi:hypothetical protein